MSNGEKYLLPYRDALMCAAQHAREVFPEESCGFIVDGRYIRAQNRAADPLAHDKTNPNCPCRLCAFEISSEDYLAVADRLEMIVHSHPNGPDYPSKSDMKHQMATNVAWVILSLDETRFGPVTVWGGKCPIDPVIGRHFIHGINDCYSLVRDVFGLGREKLAEQGVNWVFDPVKLIDAPRSDGWWNEKEDNFYEEGYLGAGFVEVSPREVQPGDVFLGKIRSNVLNHAGLLLPNNLILHHLPGRLSRREPVGIWSRSAQKWVRYMGKFNA